MPDMRSRGTLPRVARPAVLAAVLLALATGCSAGGSAGVQRAAPGAAQTTMRTGADGVSLSMKARNVDLEITGATVRFDPSGTARLDLTVHNQGPVTEHLALVSLPGGGQATLQGGTAPSGSLSTAGVRLDAGSSTAFGAKAPSIVLPPVKDLRAGGTLRVMLMFGIAGLVDLDVPVRAA
ncbi:hypothetical protein ABIA33_000147 [Streptacidiphilus sp. MAP12-16]